jgi:hypothetical protein
MGNQGSTLSNLDDRFERLRDDFNKLSPSKKSDPNVIQDFLVNYLQLQNELTEAMSAKKVKLTIYSPQQLQQAMIVLHTDLTARLGLVESAKAEKMRAEDEWKRKTAADAELRAARKALSNAEDSWESSLKYARQRVVRFQNAKPQGGGLADHDPSATAEGIAEGLKKSQAEVADLETKLQNSAQWGPEQILAWYRNTEAEKRQKADEQHRTEGLRAEKRGDERLQVALDAMTSGLNFSVHDLIVPLLDAELSDILLDPPPADNGEAAALSNFKGVTSGVFPPRLALQAVADAGFPAGLVRQVIEELINGENYGAGAGARLRSSIPKTVVKANAAGFNINHPAVKAFLTGVYRAMVTAMDSDSGGTPGNRFYRGEMKSKD